MTKKIITTINGIQITAVTNEDHEVFIPIKPICDALGIDDKTQREKIQDDEILCSVGGLRPATGADGKTYEMYCLPLQYVFGWLFTINPKNVAPDARESVSRYRRQCYDVLYRHFAGSLRRTIETNEAEIELLRRINAAISREKEAKTDRRSAEEALEKLRAERLNPQPNLFL